MKALIVIPTYNEKENIEKICSRILKSDVSILFIDDNSPDGTAEAIENVMKTENRISILKRSGKLGLGTAYVEGFLYALKNGYDKIFMMDSDLSHPPEKIPELIEADADVVIGSRYIEGGNIIGWPWYRHFLSRFANLYAGAILNMPVTDYTGGFNCINREVLENIGVDTLKGEGYGFIIELKHRAYKKKFKFKEVPITFREREDGKSKMSKKIMWEAFWLVLRLGIHA